MRHKHPFSIITFNMVKSTKKATKRKYTFEAYHGDKFIQDDTKNTKRGILNQLTKRNGLIVVKYAADTFYYDYDINLFYNI